MPLRIPESLPSLTCQNATAVGEGAALVLALSRPRRGAAIEAAWHELGSPLYEQGS
jgi:hypothetical protein